MPEGTPLGNEIDRLNKEIVNLAGAMNTIRTLQAEVAQLKRALEVVAEYGGESNDCPQGIDQICPSPGYGCSDCFRDWAMQKAKGDIVAVDYEGNRR